MQERLSYPVRIEQKLPERLAKALDQAAQQRMTSRANYVRAAILNQFRSDGIDPAQFASAA
jgi:metal-responsive CopG/Arc/MetJ family transcriptional regulator